jgi:very-short-patch-repair endonuclease
MSTSLKSPGVDAVISDLAERQHGVVARWQLTQLSLPRGAVEGRIRRKSLHRLHQGVYAVGHRALTRESRLLAAVLACGPDALLSHRCAAQLWGVMPISSIAPEVTRPAPARRRSGIVVHRSVVPPDERDAVRGIPVTSLHRTYIDMAAVARPRELERAMKEGAVRRLTDRLSIPQLLERYPGRRGSRMLGELLAAQTPEDHTRNDFEELFKATLDANGLPRPHFNAALWIRGRFFEPDCLWREQRLMVELDSREVHHTDAGFEGNRERDRILLAEGWRTARVTWRQLRHEPGAVIADLRQALAR